MTLRGLNHDPADVQGDGQGDEASAESDGKNDRISASGDAHTRKPLEKYSGVLLPQRKGATEVAPRLATSLSPALGYARGTWVMGVELRHFDVIG